MITLTAHIEEIDDNLFIGWTDNFKGLVVQGSSIKEVINELWISIKVKLAYDYKLDISKIEIASQKDIPFQKKSKDEYKFELMH